ncbi:hypothetical protein AVEN_100922-1 [Araneus ventricosus]|uniref:Uncharacterized protein n=1 Tax=Araneus ventricosus TaxID=182803 RepID=A0A4Y2AWG7_ARAVE|nr:hypothetical protein AVEN_100922-1 [Araneus ventricosus]
MAGLRVEQSSRLLGRNLLSAFQQPETMGQNTQGGKNSPQRYSPPMQLPTNPRLQERMATEKWHYPSFLLNTDLRKFLNAPHAISNNNNNKKVNE